MKLAIHAETLKALLLFAPKDDIREYLNAIRLETSPRSTKAVTGCGVSLALADVPMLGSEHAAITVPRAAVEQAVKAAKGSLVVFEFAPGDCVEESPRTVILEAEGLKISTQEITGRFPDWRRLFPANVSGELTQYDPEYLMDVKKAAKILRTTYQGIAHNGTGVGISYVGSAFVCLVMPMRGLDPRKSAPDWLNETSAESEAAE